MSWEDILKVYGPVIAWNAICLQLFILPFFRKRETLLKDYLTDGVLDAAKSYIEANKLIPTLAAIVMRVREAQGNTRRAMTKAEVQELLQGVAYIDELTKAQEAMTETNRLDALYESLERGARQIWVWGLLHVIVILAGTMVFWLPTRCRMLAFLTAGGAAGLTFIVAVIRLFVFDRRMNCFLDLIKQNRQAGGPAHG